jgi:hypothetical protein
MQQAILGSQYRYVALFGVAGAGACPARQEEECFASLRREVKPGQDQRRSCCTQQADRVLWCQYVVLSSEVEAGTGPGLAGERKDLHREGLGRRYSEAVLWGLCWFPESKLSVGELQA